MSRFDYIKGRRGRNKQQEKIKSLEKALIKSANETVNRVAKVLTTPDNKSVMEHRASILDEVMTPEKLNYAEALANLDPLGNLIATKPSREEIKKRKLIKIDRFLLKQKVAKLQAYKDALNENTEGTLWLKKTLNNILIARIEEFNKPFDSKAAKQKLFNILTNDEMAYLACMTNPNPPFKSRTVAQMFEIARKLGITINIECVKSPHALIDAVYEGTVSCYYIDGVKD